MGGCKTGGGTLLRIIISLHQVLLIFCEDGCFWGFQLWNELVCKV